MSNLNEESIDKNRIKKSSLIIVEKEKKKMPKKPKKGEPPVEIRQKRGKYKKEYLNEDGSFTVEIFPNPINFKTKRDTWEEINNNLTFMMDGNFRYPYKNISNGWEVRFADEVGEEGKGIYRMENEGYVIEVMPLGINNSKGKVKGNQILYEKIQSNIDIQYTVLADMIKEEIIFRKRDVPDTYTFQINLVGLKPVLNKDQSVDFVNVSGEIIYSFIKPFAYDKEENYTDQIITNLYQVENVWYVSYIINEAWLYNDERKFPVILDPTTLPFQPRKEETYNIRDTEIRSRSPLTNFTNYSYFAAGFSDTPSIGIRRSLIWFNLPRLYSGAKINSATLNLKQFNILTTNETIIDVHQITQPWNTQQVTWDLRPDFNQTPINGTAVNTEKIDFVVSELVSSWYTGEVANYGFLLKARDETKPRKAFYSSENNTSSDAEEGTDLGPTLVINYTVDPLGSEPFWSFVNGVNVANGNLLFTTLDVSLPGRGIPIQLTRSYNSFSTELGLLGYGWRLNIEMKLKFNAPYESKVVVFVDEDGTNHIFTELDEQDGMWEAPPGINLELKYQNGQEPYFIMTDKSETRYYFDTQNGRLEAIYDKNENVLDLVYDSFGNLVNMSDDSGRVVYFHYRDNLLFAITGNEIADVQFRYNAEGLLETVKTLQIGVNGAIDVTDSNNIAQQSSYTYYVDRKIKELIDPNGHATTVTYKLDTNQVETISKVVNGLNRIYTYEYKQQKKV
ncbi:DNRLRE domain-containing protein [Bacillus salitolerans]|uniref:DNRLRE domain-containing protein n=1 Tax=Bacillus salitolerans TaxID=1437434 RepID=A0ABW4LY11_9BACI